MFWFIISIFLLFFLFLRNQYHSQNAFYYEERILYVLKLYIRQTVRWAYSSLQDNNPLVKILHANYANSYLMVVKDYIEQFNISKETVYKLTKTDMANLERKILDIQDQATRKLLHHTRKCIKVDDNFFSQFLFNK